MTILVTGATGTVGRHLVNQLVHEGHHVRALTRNPAAAGLPDGVEVVEGDLTAPHTVEAWLDGVTGLHLITFDGADSTPLRTGYEIVDLAAKAGVQRVTVLGGWDPSTVEEALDKSDLGWTHLRPVEFMANALDYAESIKAEGRVRRYDGGALSAMVHEADIASVAAVALTRDGHAGKAYALTGPEALSLSDKLAVIGTAIGRPVEFEPLTEAEAREEMRASGFPEEYIDFAMELENNPPAEGSIVLPTVEEVTGRPARTFAQWVTEHVSAFR
ncbi:NAD(P)H-binding protein [Thermoactinospora rubra]|uniref:NAD(P)H-binding protein n=1 Tax=Thermoactinospora rubra TaxID=1088767 RepID=UPI000A1205E1|nr:NAD(P)H-binding protein [Thermoactinospora rubra]